MLSIANSSTTNRNQHTKPVTVATPLQYAGCKLSITQAVTHIRKQYRHDALALASEPLSQTVYDYAQVALPIGLGVKAITEYSQLPPHERTTHYKATMMALHTEFNELCEQEGFDALRDWRIDFNAGVPEIEIDWWYAFGTLQNQYDKHPLNYFIRAFADMVANEYGATTIDEACHFGFGFWEDYVEVQNKPKFLSRYHNIYADIEALENDDYEPEDIAEHINETYKDILLIHEYVCKEMVQACFEATSTEHSDAVKFKNSNDLFPVVLETVEMFQLWSDPIATQLINDIITFQNECEIVDIDGLERDEDTAMWQHLVLLSVTRENMSDSLCESVDRIGQDCMNHGTALKYKILLNEPSWQDDITCLQTLSAITHRYFNYEFC